MDEDEKTEDHAEESAQSADIPAQDEQTEQDSADEQTGVDEGALSAAQEALARSRGWKPKSEWKGAAPPTFIDDPSEFNRQHEMHNPRLKAENEALRRDMDELKQISRQQFDMLRSSKDAEIKRLKSGLQERMRNAVSVADTEAYDQAAREMQALEAATPQTGGEGGQPPPTAPPPNAPPPSYNPNTDPNFVSWHQENAWYGTDGDKTAFAERVAAPKVRQMGLTPNHGRAYYDAISGEVNRVFPSAGDRSTPSPGAAAKAGGSKKKQNGFDTLPGKVKEDFQRVLVKKLGVYKNDEKGRAEYAKAYYEENPQPLRMQ